MKILEIICSFSPGGIERFVVDLCNEMSKFEDVTLLTLKDDNKGNNGFYKSELKSRVNHVCLGWKDGMHFEYLFRIVSVIKGLSPDIVHFHGAAAKYLLLANLFLGHKIKFVQTIHNDIYKGYSNLFSKIQINCCSFWGKLNFVTISKTNKDQFSTVYHRLKSTLIYNGRVKLEKTNEFECVRDDINFLKKDSDTIVFLHVARFHPQKNQKLLINSFNELLKRGENVILLIIGDGFDTEQGKFLKEKSEKGIYYLGTRGNIQDYMYNADAFCLSSNYEGMPIVVIESLLCGLPIISTPVSGVIDVVTKNINGLISNSFSLDDYIKVINQFIGQKDRIKIRSTLQEANSSYTIENCASKYLTLFHSFYD